MDVHVPPEESALVDRTMGQIRRPGTWLAGDQRVEVAGGARAAARGGDAPGPGAFNQAVAVMATGAHTIRQGHVESLAVLGLEPLAYLEVLSIVARVRAVDTFCFALGAPEPALGAPEPGEPTRRAVSGAALSGGWLPTVGPAGARNALSAVPAEQEASHDLHGVFYLTMEAMPELDADRGLHRTQMEVVAARTSYLNECYY